VRDVVIAGVVAATGVIFAGASTTLVAEGVTAGSLPGGAFFYAQNARGMVLRDVQCMDFINYGALGNYARQKATNTWVKATQSNPATDSHTASYIIVENFTGDENAVHQFDIDGYKDVKISFAHSNAAYLANATGIKLTNVDRALIENCWMGYNAADDPAFALLTTCGDVEINRCSGHNSVKRVVVDDATRLTVRNSPTLVIDRS
jgi:hypothetical protein